MLDQNKPACRPNFPAPFASRTPRSLPLPFAAAVAAAAAGCRADPPNTLDNGIWLPFCGRRGQVVSKDTLSVCVCVCVCSF